MNDKINEVKEKMSEQEFDDFSDLEDEIDRIKRIDFAKEYVSVKSYWRKYVKTHNGLNLKEPQSSYDEKI